MKNAIQHYLQMLHEKGKGIHSFWKIGYQEYAAKADPELVHRFEAGELIIKRQKKPDLSLYEREIGRKVPDDLAELLGYWQPGIFGFYKDYRECFMLFSAVRFKGEGEDDFLQHKDSLIGHAKSWVYFGGDLKRYIPIGIYDVNSSNFLLYEVGTGRIFIEDWDNEGEVEDEPAAESLKELIAGLYLL
jgi:hypothetical protein